MFGVVQVAGGQPSLCTLLCTSTKTSHKGTLTSATDQTLPNCTPLVDMFDDTLTEASTVAQYYSNLPLHHYNNTDEALLCPTPLRISLTSASCTVHNPLHVKNVKTQQDVLLLISTAPSGPRSESRIPVDITRTDLHPHGIMIF